MVAENPTWGAPRIHGELLMLGFAVSERTISRGIKSASKDPESAPRWRSFLRNHHEAIAAMDFVSVPTVTFGVLYGFFIIAHDRRRILHYNVTRHPTSAWIVQRPGRSYDGCSRLLPSTPRKDSRGQGVDVNIILLVNNLDERSKAKLKTLATETDGFRVYGREVYWWRRKRPGTSLYSNVPLTRVLSQPFTIRGASTMRRLAAKWLYIRS
jgi:hypothetical protein